jgi:hypothetical protein
MKILILTTAYGRPKVFVSFLKYYLRIKKAYPQIECLVVNSEGVLENMCNVAGVHYLSWKNRPLGGKWNAGLRYAKNLEWDYLLIMGSDDITNTEIFDTYERWAIADYDLIGFKDAYFYDMPTKNLRYWSGYENQRKGEPTGAGRLIKRSVIEKLNYELWDGTKEKYLDSSMTKKLRPLKLKYKVLSLRETGDFLMGIKSAGNITAFSQKFKKVKGKSISMDIFKKHLPEDEIKLL